MEEYEVSQEGRVVLMRAGSKLDFRVAEAVKRELLTRLEHGATHVVLDLSQTGVLDSTGLGVLFVVHRRLVEARGAVVFVAPSYPVRSVIQLTRTGKLFRTFQTTAQAMAALGRG